MKLRKEEAIMLKRTFQSLLTYLILIVGGTIFLIPFLWMISTSLKTLEEVFLFPPVWFPEKLIWQNYRDVWRLVPFSRFFINSLFLSTIAVVGTLFCSSLAAFAFARMDFPGRDALFLLYLATIMVPAAVTMIPLFILMRLVNWMDTYYALIAPTVLGNAFATFLLRQFFLTLPKELDDAALIDGCSPFRIYCYVTLPLSKPALSALGVFTWLGSWNDFLWPLIIISSPQRMPITAGLAFLQGAYTTRWPLIMAGAVMALVPMLVVFFIGQRYFIQGIALTGIKG
jgi:multiple sugar transport system permease protein